MMRLLFFPLLLLLSIAFAAELDDCGRSNHRSNETLIPDKLGRIIGGNNAPLGKWPWQVELVDTRYQNITGGIFCGGTIIAARWILTAAHCFGPNLNVDFILYGGVESSAMNKTVLKNVTIHSEYDPSKKLFSDIALIELNEPIDFDYTASPVCLPSIETNIPTDAQVIATGFGWANGRHNSGDFRYPKELKETVFSLVPLNVCSQRYNNASLHDSQICGGSYGHGTAPVDSGGPVVIYSKSKRWFQVGVTSWGDNDVKTGGIIEQDRRPGVYTNVQKYCDWIKEKTRGEAKCRDGGELIDATSA